MKQNTTMSTVYKHKEPALALKRIREVEALGYKAIFLTVDAIVAGNRERDVRAGWAVEDAEEQQGGGSKPRKKTDMEELESELDVRGTAGALVANDDRDMTWDTVSFILRGVKEVFITLWFFFRRSPGSVASRNFQLSSRVSNVSR